MRRFLPISLMLLLATSCPRKAGVLELSPPAADSTRDPRADVVALVERVAARHDFAKSVTMDEVECIRTWRRPADDNTSAFSTPVTL